MNQNAHLPRDNNKVAIGACNSGSGRSSSPPPLIVSPQMVDVAATKHSHGSLPPPPAVATAVPRRNTLESTKVEEDTVSERETADARDGSYSANGDDTLKETSPSLATSTGENPLLTEATTRPKNEKDSNFDGNDDGGSESSSIDTPTHETRCQRWSRRSWTFYINYQFPIHLVIAIALARAYPPLPSEYVKPKITASSIAVAIIFFVSGIGLRTEQFTSAIGFVYFNVVVQIFNFFVVSSVVFGLSRFLVLANILPQPMADGLAICGCLSVSVNAAIMLSGSAGGNEASAVFHATVGNLTGIFLSPLLILGYLGQTGNVKLIEVFLYLTYRVIIPLIVGQIVQRIFTCVREFCYEHKRSLKRVQETSLVFIVYTVFGKTFASDTRAGLGNVAIVMVCVGILIVTLFIASWFLLRFLFPNEPELRVTGLFNCVSKTIALGVPLITSMYEDDPNIALYTLPILLWHPMFLVIGSMLVPRLTIFVEAERFRIDMQQNNDNSDEGEIIVTSMTNVDNGQNRDGTQQNLDQQVETMENATPVISSS